MPELPEVEAIRRGLVSHLQNRQIQQVEVLLPKIVAGRGTQRQASDQKTQRFVQAIQGATSLNLTRRAKNLIWELDSGVVVIHLKMTGQLVFQGDQNSFITGGHPIEDSEYELPHKHTRLIFHLDNGKLFFNDTRQFGYVLFFASWEELSGSGHFEGLGLEPLSEEFTFEKFYEKMKGRTGNLKKTLLDQKVVVGLGNIYCDECCFAAGIRPGRSVKNLQKKELKRLYEAMVEILPKAVAEGGSSVANYLLADGSRGNYARYHQVYNRKGKPCLVCGETLKSKEIGGRTTVYCARCQG